MTLHNVRIFKRKKNLKQELNGEKLNVGLAAYLRF